ncbi:hypothetical protein CEUSTIGMA_g6993.t1 [Chlamydomonas eustigma]|uniref:PUA domain-containing protein n=1 Tax=Chlamydomonas eustigma TaxID=1157962 RepID=A0A250X9L1_9CHLO|nr:hypothetical protein CEUSTIGMA_g6993.t1 [Chlamydomonas eustigma]|eukprot:GAX79552.1 hypothetical protein CEUSTIGMA_g6993.t1 [Chlamydomonas eustigma]
MNRVLKEIMTKGFVQRPPCFSFSGGSETRGMRRVNVSSGYRPDFKASKSKADVAEKKEATLDVDMLLSDRNNLELLRGNLVTQLKRQDNTASKSGNSRQSSSSGVARTKNTRDGNGMSNGRGGHSSNQDRRGSTSQREKSVRYGKPQTDNQNYRGGSRNSEPYGGSNRSSSGRGGSNRAFNPAPFDNSKIPADAPVAILKPGKEWLFKRGSPMVYSGAIDRVLSPGGFDVMNDAQITSGDNLLIADSEGSVVGWGVFNPVSMFRIRLMQIEQECQEEAKACYLDMPALINKRVQQAKHLRISMGMPTNGTDVYRLINSEGDRLSGVIADVLGSTVVVQSGSAWAERYRKDLEHAIAEATGLQQIVWRPMENILKQEGWKGQEKQTVKKSEGAFSSVEGVDETEGDLEDAAESAEVVADSAVSEDDPPENLVAVQEGGVKFLTSPLGQKTGFYADQRESRAYLATMCRGKSVLDLCCYRCGGKSVLDLCCYRCEGKSVLDLCCYSGAFTIHAAKAGATAALGVDSSASAIKLAMQNASLNHVSNIATFVEDDITRFMRLKIEEGVQYDIVILDPPKLAPTRSSLMKATIKYQSLNTMALKLVRPGGLFMTCSCSGAMTQSGQLTQVVNEAAHASERQITLLRDAGPSADHPLNPAYPEGAYLTNLLYCVS